MAKIEKIGNIQVVDNKADKSFYFPMISMACTGSGYTETLVSHLQAFFFYWVAKKIKSSSSLGLYTRRPIC